MHSYEMSDDASFTESLKTLTIMQGKTRKFHLQPLPAPFLCWEGFTYCLHLQHACSSHVCYNHLQMNPNILRPRGPIKMTWETG